jgi:hypothetical protein
MDGKAVRMALGYFSLEYFSLGHFSLGHFSLGVDECNWDPEDCSLVWARFLLLFQQVYISFARRYSYFHGLGPLVDLMGAYKLSCPIRTRLAIRLTTQ